MTFVMLADGKSYVPLSEVKFVEESRGDLLILTMRDGSSFEIYSYQWKHLTDQRFQQIIPAAPGTLLICETAEEKFDPQIFEPVVGWGISDAGAVLPITHYGVPEFDNPHVVHPEGKVTNNGGGVWGTLAEYVAFVEEARVEQAAA